MLSASLAVLVALGLVLRAGLVPVSFAGPGDLGQSAPPPPGGGGNPPSVDGGGGAPPPADAPPPPVQKDDGGGESKPESRTAPSQDEGAVVRSPLRVETVPNQQPSADKKAGSTPPRRVSSVRPPAQSPAVTECQRSAIGGERYAAIQEGRERPTPDESEKASQCFKSPVNHYEYVAGALPRRVDACLRRQLGAQRVAALASGEAVHSLDELRSARTCFGMVDEPLAPLPTIALPKVVEACLAERIGASRLAAVSGGAGEPTEAERGAAAECFRAIGGLQPRLLPLPPEQVPFLVPDPSATSVTGAQTVEEAVNGRVAPRIVFEGRGPVNALVELYLFSANPIVVALAMDANGVWRYELDQPLSVGDHRALSVVKLQGRDPVRSTAFPFAVARAAATDERDEGLIIVEESVPAAARGYLTTALLVVAGALVVVFVGLARRQHQSKPGVL